jgi:hypothetical protein
MTEDEIISQLIEAQSITAERLKFDFISKLETNIKQGSDVPFYLQNFKEDFKIKLIEAFNLCFTTNLIHKSDQKKYWKYIKTDDHWAALNKEALEYSLDKFEETTTDYAWIAVHLFEIYLAEEVALVESELIKNGVERSSWESITDVIHKKWYEKLNKYILKVPGGTLYELNRDQPKFGSRIDLDISEEDNIMNALENGGFD